MLDVFKTSMIDHPVLYVYLSAMIMYCRCLQKPDVSEGVLPGQHHSKRKLRLTSLTIVG